MPKNITGGGSPTRKSPILKNTLRQPLNFPGTLNDLINAPSLMNASYLIKLTSLYQTPLSNKRPPSVNTTHKLETDVQYNQSIYLRSCLMEIELP